MAEEIKHEWVTGRSMETEVSWEGVEFIAEFKNGERHRIVGYMDENCDGEVSMYIEDADNGYCPVDENEVVRWKILEREDIMG